MSDRHNSNGGMPPQMGPPKFHQGNNGGGPSYNNNNNGQQHYHQNQGRQLGGMDHHNRGDREQQQNQFLAVPQSSTKNPGAPDGVNYNELESFVNSYLSTPNLAKLKQKVCVHWLKKTCRKGDNCEYLHMYREDKIPICKFFKENGHCHQQDTQCVYRHPKEPEPGASKKQEQCPYYERGFCKMGRINCQFWHGHETNYEKACLNYLLGFCPDGPNCKFTHVRSFIAPQDLSLKKIANFPMEEDWMDGHLHSLMGRHHGNMGHHNMGGHHGGGYQRQQIHDQKFICYRCGDPGHKSTYCQEDAIPPSELEKIQAQNPENGLVNQRVVCFSCHQKGHYANACPQKAQRTAVNAAGQDKPAMTREEQLFNRIDRLDEIEQHNGGGTGLSHLGTQGAHTTQDATQDGSEGGQGAGSQAYNNMSQKSMNGNGAGYNGNGRGGGSFNQMQDLESYIMSFGGDQSQLGASNRNGEPGGPGRNHLNDRQGNMNRGNFMDDSRMNDEVGQQHQHQLHQQQQPYNNGKSGALQQQPMSDKQSTQGHPNNNSSSQGFAAGSNGFDRNPDKFALIENHESASYHDGPQGSETTGGVDSIRNGGAQPTQQLQQLASQQHQEDVARGAQFVAANPKINNDLIANEKEFDPKDLCSQNNAPSSQQMLSCEQLTSQAVKVASNSVQSSSTPLPPNALSKPSPDPELTQQQQQPSSAEKPQDDAEMEIEMESVLVSGVDVQDLPFSVDQIREAIFDCEGKIHLTLGTATEEQMQLQRQLEQQE